MSLTLGTAEVNPLQDLSQTQQKVPGSGRKAAGKSSSSNSQESSSISAFLPGQPSGASIGAVPFESSQLVPQPPAFFKACVSSASSKEAAASEQASLGHKFSVTGSRDLAAAVTSVPSMANYKTTLNTFCQRNRIAPPIYDCIYPEDEVGYIVVIKVNYNEFKSTPHGTKRGAESMAAAMALKSMGVDIEIAENGDAKNERNCPDSLVAPPQIPGKFGYYSDSVPCFVDVVSAASSVKNETACVKDCTYP